MATPRLDDLLDISFKLNEAVLNQDKWKGALQCMADVFVGSFATFEVYDKNGGPHVQHHDSSDLEIQGEYLAHYMPINPRISFGTRPTSPNIMHDALILSEQEMDRNEFYVDFLQAYDLQYFLAYKAYNAIDQIGVFTIQKSKTSGPASNDELLAVKELAPTFARVANLQVKHHELLGHIHNLESMFDAANDGVMFLDRTGCMIEMNQSAEKLLSDQDGLVLFNRKPSCTDPDADIRLSKLIFTSANINSLQEEKQFLLARPSGLPPYQISAQRIKNTDKILSGSRACTMLIIRDPAISTSLEIETLMDCFGFTHAEANVSLAMAKGKSAQEIAQSTTTSLATIRTHMQRIMQKMSVNRQSEVTRILSKYL